MADYYSLLARAIGNLPKTASPAVRKAVYDRARTALVNQLRSMKPPLPEADILREQGALDAAVARIEAETAVEGAFLNPAAPADQPPAKTAAGIAAAPPKPTPANPTPAKPAASVRPAAVPAKPPLAAPVDASAPVRPAMPAAAPPRPPASNYGAPPPKPPAAPSPPPLTAKPSDEETRAPSLGAASRDEFEQAESAAPIRVTGDASRPAAPGPDEEPRPRSLVVWFAVGAVLAFVAMIAVAAFLFRQSAQDFLKIPSGPPSAAASPAAAATPSPGKVAQRVGAPEAKDTPTPSPAAAPSPTAATAASPAPGAAATPSAAPPAAPAPVPSASPPPADGAASPAPAATGAATIPVGARAAVLIANSADPQAQPALHMGTVVWTQTPGAAGQPPIVKASADIPDLKLRAEVALRKNVDAALPASHVFDVRFILEDGGEIKAVNQMQKPLMHMDDGQRLDPLAGAAVKFSDNHFVVGLSKADADLANNLNLLATHPWFDFPVLLADGRIAKLTIEKGPDGEAIMAQALAAWK